MRFDLRAEIAIKFIATFQFKETQSTQTFSQL